MCGHGASLNIISGAAAAAALSHRRAAEMAARLWALLVLQPLAVMPGKGAATAPRPVGFSEMECQMHTLALRFAENRQPAMSSSAHRSLADALHLEQLCGTSARAARARSSSLIRHKL